MPRKNDDQIVIAYKAPGDLILIIATLQEQYRSIIELPGNSYPELWASLPEIEALILALMSHLLKWYNGQYHLRTDRLAAINREATQLGFSLDLSRWLDQDEK